MNIHEIRTGRFILYLDILGFRGLIQTLEPSQIYSMLDRMIQESGIAMGMLQEFRTLYFSDTIIIYQEPMGYGAWAFRDFYPIAARLWSALAAREIPTRGALAFGQFDVEIDQSGQHSVYFGKALIEAHDLTEPKDGSNDWIGIRVCPSVIEVLSLDTQEPGMVQMLSNDDEYFDYFDEVERRTAISGIATYLRKLQPTYLIREKEETLLLNPLYIIYETYTSAVLDEGVIDGPLKHWLRPHFPNALRALAFMIETERKLSAIKSTDQRILRKYQFTVKHLNEALTKDVIGWALEAHGTLDPVDLVEESD